MPLLFQWRRRRRAPHVSERALRNIPQRRARRTASPTPAGGPLRFTPHDFRRMFITDAIMSGLPPHIAQIIAGHRDINTTMGYKAVYPDEAINAHRAFIARRRALRPSEEYRTPTDEEWDEFLGHFERRKVSIGDLRPRVRHALHPRARLHPLPAAAARPRRNAHRLAEIRDNLAARIAEAEREGWLGEVEGLKVSLAGANDKLAQIDQLIASRTTPSSSASPPSPTSPAAPPPTRPPRPYPNPLPARNATGFPVSRSFPSSEKTSSTPFGWPSSPRRGCVRP